MDPDKDSCDLVLFDGASNVKKVCNIVLLLHYFMLMCFHFSILTLYLLLCQAGQILGAEYPRITCLKGSEHIISLFFSDVAKLPFMKSLIQFHMSLYSWFGSGARHKSYAIFESHVMEQNGGKKLGLIRASDTRMAGHFITELRSLRLKKAFLRCVNSVEFFQLDQKPTSII